METKDSLHEKRKEFARKFDQLLNDPENDRPIIYIDETTVNNWIPSDRSWSFAEAPVYQILGDKRFSASVIGAISTCLQDPVYILTEDQRKETILDFFKYLYKKIPVDDRNKIPIVIIDNLSGHHSGIVTAYCKSKFDLWFIPPYSCEFNSIETYWAVGKRAFKKANLVHRFTVKTREEFLARVRNSLQIKTEIHHNLCNANRDYIQKILTS